METACALAFSLLVLVMGVSSETLGYEGCWSGKDVAGSGLPWHASIFLQLEEVPGVFQYQGAGVLVSVRYLLTDMSALEGEAPDYRARPPSQLFVMLGAATASWQPEAPGVVISKVSRVLVDDAYNSAYAFYYHSLAVVELEVPLAITDAVRPLCVDSSAQPQPGDAAFMVIPDLNKNLTLKTQKLKYISREDCVGDSIYASLAEKKFCANSSEEAVCPGARGGALLWRSGGGRWLLKGVLAVNTAQEGWGLGRCVAGHHVFSAVDDHLPLLRAFLLSSCFSGRPSAAPWHAQLYLRNSQRRGLQYACAAALLTHRYLLTDGSCFKDIIGNNVTGPSDFVVALGKKVKSLQTKETGSQILKVSRVELQDGGRGLAIVQLEAPAALGQQVAAVCLDTAAQQPLRDATAAVVATFHHPENSTVKLLYVNVVDSKKCVLEKPDIKPFLSASKFCAIDKKAAVCQGNEGSAMLTRGPERDAWWAVRGILTTTPRTFMDGDACPKGNALFISVGHSLRWILDTLKHLSVPRSVLKPEGVKGCWSGHAGNSSWHALIYRQQQRPQWFDLACAGTIVSRRHVLTDAVCLWNSTSGTLQDISKLRITAGKTIRDWNANENDVQIRKISQVFMQPDNQSSALSVGGLAVAVLDKPLETSDTVHSVCIDGPDGSRSEHGETGLVASLGFQRSSELKILNMKVLMKNECLSEVPFKTGWTIVSDKFCAIDHKVSDGTCPGDVGAGFVARGAGGAWLLKGVATPGHERRDKPPPCSRVAVFTAVHHSRHWLLQVLQANTSYH